MSVCVCMSMCVHIFVGVGEVLQDRMVWPESGSSRVRAAAAPSSHLQLQPWPLWNQTVALAEE